MIIILAGIGNLGSNEGNSNTQSATTTSNSSSKKETKEQPKEQQVFKVGDVIKTNKFEITITSIQEKAKVGSQYFESSPSEGGTYVAIQWKYKNTSDKPIGAFSFPVVRLLDKNGTKYDSDITASSSFATELKLDEKILSDLNPGITVKAASVFEVSKDSFKQGGWKLLVDADKDMNVNVN